MLEYKNPNDSLHERVLYKAAGYAFFLIGTAEHERDVPADQVTVSIFRAAKNLKFFREMEGKISSTETPGIYRVHGIIDLPFQIVITSELQGEEYAAYRALTDKAREVDVERVIEAGGKEENDVLRGYYKILLDLIADKNPDIFEAIRGDDHMKSALMEIMKDEFVKTEEKGRAEGRAEGENKMADLIKILISLGRNDDIAKAAADEQYRTKLFSDFGMA